MQVDEIVIQRDEKVITRTNVEWVRMVMLRTMRDGDDDDDGNDDDDDDDDMMMMMKQWISK